MDYLSVAQCSLSEYLCKLCIRPAFHFYRIALIYAVEENNLFIESLPYFG